MPRWSERVPFLRAIADAPGDSLPKLVYADFLEERGDPSGGWYRYLGDKRPAPLRMVVRRGHHAPYGIPGLAGWCQWRPGEVRLPWMVPASLYWRLPGRYRVRHPARSGRDAKALRCFRCFRSDGRALAALRGAYMACVLGGLDQMTERKPTGAFASPEV